MLLVFIFLCVINQTKDLTLKQTWDFQTKLVGNNGTRSTWVDKTKMNDFTINEWFYSFTICSSLLSPKEWHLDWKRSEETSFGERGLWWISHICFIGQLFVWKNKKGGLGFKSLSLFNKTLLGEWSWRFVRERNPDEDEYSRYISRKGISINCN